MTIKNNQVVLKKWIPRPCGEYQVSWSSDCPVWFVTFIISAKHPSRPNWASRNEITGGGGDKIVALEKTTWFHFHLIKKRFSFFCCRPCTSWPVVYKSPKRKEPSIMSESDTMFNKRDLPIKVMITGPLPAPSKCKSGLSRITGTCQGWWKQSFRQSLWSLVWFQVRATSCHLTSSKST